MTKIYAEGVIEGDQCNRNKCAGVMEQVKEDGVCSCHINPPCSYCVNECYICPVCGFETEQPEAKKPSKKPNHGINQSSYYRRKSSVELFNELDNDTFGYVTIPGHYYWMEYKGKYPKGMTVEEIISNFNTCFGLKWLIFPRNGQFHIKVYTD